MQVPFFCRSAVRIALGSQILGISSGRVCSGLGALDGTKVALWLPHTEIQTEKTSECDFQSHLRPDLTPAPVHLAFFCIQPFGRLNRNGPPCLNYC